jgi:hypothetical protein
MDHLTKVFGKFNLLLVLLHLRALSRLAKLLLNDWRSNFRYEQHRL